MACLPRPFNMALGVTSHTTVPPIRKNQFHPLMSLTSSLESLAPTRCLGPIKSKTLSLQDDFHEVRSLIAFFFSVNRQIRGFHTPLRAPPSGFFNLLTVCSSPSLAALFHATSAFRVRLLEFMLVLAAFTGLTPALFPLAVD